MKTPFLLALSGLAIGFAVPTLAQQKETVDPQVREQIDANIKKSDEAFNNNDAAALAALLTEDAIVVTERGPVFGREPMERYWETEFRYLHFSNHLTKRDPASPHVIGTAGNEVWSTGEWSGTFQGQNGSPVQANAGSSNRTLRAAQSGRPSTNRRRPFSVKNCGYIKLYQMEKAASVESCVNPNSSIPQSELIINISVSFGTKSITPSGSLSACLRSSSPS